MTSIARQTGEHKYPRFTSLSNRLKSFDTARTLLRTRGGDFTDTLAANGFFYLGGGDQVKCYHCGVDLYGWVEPDDVMVEHYRHSPDCRLAKEGMNFNPRTEKLAKAVLKTMQKLKKDLVERNSRICFV